MSDKLANRKCFVTGGSGFIGSYIIETLLSRGCMITAYDNLVSGKKTRLENSLRNPRFKFVQGDLTDYDNLEKQMKGHDIVWHFGANTNMRIGLTDPKVDFSNGLIGTFNVLNAMRSNGIGELIFPSSGAVYGDITRPPASEEYGPLLPVSTYGAGKLSAEGWISAYWHLANIRSWIFRFGNVLGARMTHGVIYDLLNRLQSNSEELEVLGDGTGEKNYFLVEECIDGIIYAYNHSNHDGAEIFNLGSDTTTRVSQIVKIILEETGKNPKIRYTGGERGWPGDQPRVYMNIEKMKKLGWSTKLSSDEAVRIAVRRYLGKA
ncbi:MAG TPA: NAD-dependent epimerase/dehydratase family protein [Candidatus Bathyarchaeia archaeon]|nr:NAD-dependent epimerase/dehydratase family protein [Candidatus Bathyarchaeia archaeon]